MNEAGEASGPVYARKRPRSLWPLSFTPTPNLESI